MVMVRSYAVSRPVFSDKVLLRHVNCENVNFDNYSWRHDQWHWFWMDYDFSKILDSPHL